ncbi:ATP-binding protein [Methylocystis bryophila]|uniref:Anti-sigma factor n=1 Tax=Methylocystis bryophila TaxID=655015 RepID=A0A1W6MXT9_9HYPH|nr:ATP-binding protein [Methylocystis bryophila]ARN82407.1 anti-sigma factor [Methylocystis bryophila]BDV38584.1 anti-sigma factor [Methylocystis bryophila]
MCDAAETILNLDIQIPNQTRYLGLIGNIAELIAKEVDASSADRDTLAYHLNLVVTEAVTNAIQYGFQSEEHDRVRVLLSYENSDLCVRVYDHGQGFDLPVPNTAELDELRERGRGLFFIRTLMDTVEYRRTESGNVLEMKKRLL